MRYFDTFDENGVFQSSADEADVHYKGLWHKVIRIWLYDKEGNIYLRIRKEDQKLDCITELHVESSESIVNCFDRGLYEKIGVHLPATSNVEQAHFRKKKFQKVFSDNSEIRDNFFLCDYICILVFCPFQTCIMKNKCCVNCRIYDWGHFMMFTPMLFIPNFYSWSLFFTSCVVLIRWELVYAAHPERFWSGSNQILQCENCKDKTCQMKRRVRNQVVKGFKK